MAVLKSAIGGMIPKPAVPAIKKIERFEDLGLSESEQTYSTSNFYPGQWDTGYSVALSTSNVTQGTYSLRWQDGSTSNIYQMIGSGFLKRAGDTLLKLDVYVQAPTGGQTLFFEIERFSLIDSVVINSSGLQTLELDVSGVPNNDTYGDIKIYMFSGSNFTMDVYLDNMRVVRNGVETVLWGFEELPLAQFESPYLTTAKGNSGLSNGSASGSPGDDYLTSGGRVAVTRSTTVKTQGAYSWKFENDGEFSMSLLSTIPMDITDYLGGTLKIDFNVTVSTGAGIDIDVLLVDGDGTIHSTCSLTSAATGVSSGTLTSAFGADAGFDTSEVYFVLDITVPEDGDIVYIDNLRIEP